MDWTLEVVVVPVADVDRAIAFYRDQIGFHLDHDTRGGPMRFAQLTPRGSGCSIVLSDPPPMPAGSLRGLQLVVSDARAARDHLVAQGVAVGDVNVLDDRDGGTMFDFADPDGNAWVVQQIKARGGTPLLPR
jgi:catechol 2,3-dioxygenase-like lactoylglutathione lyase family enzyme